MELGRTSTPLLKQTDEEPSPEQDNLNNADTIIIHDDTPTGSEKIVARKFPNCFWVSNIDETVTAVILRNHFMAIGKTLTAKIVTNGEDVYGYVAMENEELATRCINELNNSMIGDHKITVSRKHPEFPPLSNANGLKRKSEEVSSYGSLENGQVGNEEMAAEDIRKLELTIKDLNKKLKYAERDVVKLQKRQDKDKKQFDHLRRKYKRLEADCEKLRADRRHFEKEKENFYRMKKQMEKNYENDRKEIKEALKEVKSARNMLEMEAKLVPLSRKFYRKSSSSSASSRSPPPLPPLPPAKYRRRSSARSVESPLSSRRCRKHEHSDLPDSKKCKCDYGRKIRTPSPPKLTASQKKYFPKKSYSSNHDEYSPGKNKQTYFNNNVNKFGYQHGQQPANGLMLPRNNFPVTYPNQYKYDSFHPPPPSMPANVGYNYY